MRRNEPVRRPVRRGIALLAVLATALALPTAGRAEPGPVPRAVTISKTSDLVDKEQVTISWQGFTPGAEVYIHQCLNPPASWEDCAEVSRHVAVSGPDGAGTTTYRITAGDLLQWDYPPHNPRLRCDGSSCAVALSECGVDLAAEVTRITPISIRPGAAPPPMEPDPETGELPFAPATVPAVVEPPLVLAEPPRVPVTLPLVVGDGASGARQLMARWQAAAQQPPASVLVDYIANNSPTGNENFVKGLTDFAVTADPLTPAQVAELRAAGRGFAYAPVAASGLAVVFNMFAHTIRQTKLNLRADHLAQLYGNAAANPTIRVPAAGTELNGRLSHPSVQAVNQGCTFDVSGETRVAAPFFRTDRSSANRVFTNYLATRGSLWMAGPVSEFPNTESLGASGTDGLAEKVARPRTPGAGETPSPVPDPANHVPMGYVDVSQVKLRAMTVAGVENSSGSFVRPTPEALAAAFQPATVGADGLVQLPATDGPGAYPMPVVYYLLVPTTTSASFTPAMGEALRAFINYAVSDAGQQQAVQLGMLPLPPTLRAAALATAARLPTVPPPETHSTTTTTTVSGTPTNPTTVTTAPAGVENVPTSAVPTAAGGDESEAASSPAPSGATPDGGAPGGGAAGGPSVLGARPAASRSDQSTAPPAEPAAPAVPANGNKPGPVDDLLRAPSALLRRAGFVPTLSVLFTVGLLAAVGGRLGRRRLQSR